MKSNNQVAHELMGLCWHDMNKAIFSHKDCHHTTYTTKCSKCGARGSQHRNPSYDTSFQESAILVEFLKKKGWSCVIANNACADTQNGCKFFEDFRGLGSSLFDVEKHKGFSAIAKTIPEAITLAAIEVMKTL